MSNPTQPHEREAGHSLTVLLVTMIALAAVWAVVWLNVPRGLNPSPSAPSPADVAALIPPALMKSSGEPAHVPQPPTQRHEARNALTPIESTAPDPGTARRPGLSDRGAQFETALECREEARKLCGEIEPGSGRFHDCLQRHRELMSAACQRTLEERLGPRAEGARAILAACRPDLRRWCPNIPLRGAPVIRCLREHASALSRLCVDVLAEARVL